MQDAGYGIRDECGRGQAVNGIEFLGRARYDDGGFGRAENRSRRKPGEESPNSIGRDAA